jgi:Tol biopolymer transport system component/DNA-binding winged helix-turn-helix (wHTH) protein
MPADVVRFGNDIELDRGAYELRRSGRTLKLERIPMEILLLLVERRGQLVSREDIIEKAWGRNVHLDTDNSINAAVRKIRQVLRDDPERPLFVQTVTGKGYRFIAKVNPVLEEMGDPILENQSSGNGSAHRTAIGDQSFAVVREGGSLAVAASAESNLTGQHDDGGASPRPAAMTAVPARQKPAVSSARKSRSPRLLLLAVATLVALGLSAAWLRPVARPPQVKAVRQITHIGTVVTNQNLLVKGSRVYFAASDRGNTKLQYVSLDSDVVSPVEEPFPTVDIFDIPPSGNELLMGEVVHGFTPADWRRTLWRLPLPNGAPQRVGNVFADDAAWSPDGRTIAYTNEPDHSLNLVDSDGSNVRTLAILPGVPFKPRWSPDGKKIRISVLDKKGSGISLWQLNTSGDNLIRMLPGWSASSRAWAGRWSRDGRYFFFTGFQGGKRNIWALRDGRDFFRRDGTQPVQLTAGPLDFYLPTPGSDGKTLYAVGIQLQGELRRYNATSRQFEPYWDGLSADYLSFSRDGKWMAYVTYPEGALVRSRLDGSERLQLTSAPMRAFDLRWSPDGSLIAFVGTANVGAPQRVYVVPSDGGSPRLAAPDSITEQALADWSHDGESLLYASADASGSTWTSHALNMKTGRAALLPGTVGMGVGRVSPDGRYLAGLSFPAQNLLLYDMNAATTRQLAEFADYPNWSSDGKYVYYSTLSRAYLLSPEKTGVFRVNVADGSVERVAPLPPFPLSGNWGIWCGLAPDDSVLVMRELGKSDIYALDVDLP